MQPLPSTASLRSAEESAFLESEAPDIPLIGYLPADMRVQEADRLGVPVYDHVESLKLAAEQINKKINEFTNDEVFE